MMLHRQGSNALLGVEDERRPYYAFIEAYAEERFQQLARKVIARLQRRAPSDLLEGKMLDPKTLWDEVCWFLKKGYGDTTPVARPFNTTIDIFCDVMIAEISDAEAALLICAVTVPAEGQDLMLARKDSELRRALRAYVHEIASSRDMKKFEIH